MCFPTLIMPSGPRPPGAHAEVESGAQEMYGGAGEGGCPWKANHREKDRRSIISNGDADLISLCQAHGELQSKHCPSEASGRNSMLTLTTFSKASHSWTP